MNKIIFLELNHPELAWAWNMFPDKSMYNDTYGESLQYMGTVLDADTYVVHHEFRHRAVPGTNQRKYWHIHASLKFSPIDFERLHHEGYEGDKLDEVNA